MPRIVRLAVLRLLAIVAVGVATAVALQVAREPLARHPIVRRIAEATELPPAPPPVRPIDPAELERLRDEQARLIAERRRRGLPWPPTRPRR